MVKAEINQTTGNGTIILTPNNSASWEFNMIVISSLAVIAGVFSIYFLWQGLWLILPLSGLGILALFSALYLSLRNNFITEVITFRDHLLIVERGHRTIEHSWEYQRIWTKIFVRKSPFRGHPKKIMIRSYGKELEIGTFLNQGDKEILIKKLKHIIYC